MTDEMRTDKLNTLVLAYKINAVKLAAYDEHGLECVEELKYTTSSKTVRNTGFDDPSEDPTGETTYDDCGDENNKSYDKCLLDAAYEYHKEIAKIRFEQEILRAAITDITKPDDPVRNIFYETYSETPY